VAVGDEEVTDLAGLWRRIWACGRAGAEVPLTLARDPETVAVLVKSADRTSYLKSPRLH
jgi:S1-C subfamily serine protease